MEATTRAQPELRDEPGLEAVFRTAPPEVRDYVASLHEELQGAYMRLSGKAVHRRECATTFGVPTYRPGPCDCDAPPVPFDAPLAGLPEWDLDPAVDAALPKVAREYIGGLHEELASRYIELSGTPWHSYECPISRAYAHRPGPCMGCDSIVG